MRIAGMVHCASCFGERDILHLRRSICPRSYPPHGRTTGRAPARIYHDRRESEGKSDGASDQQREDTRRIIISPPAPIRARRRQCNKSEMPSSIYALN
jgi:hypothetical protein